MVRLGFVWLGLGWWGVVWFGLVRFGLVWFGLGWLGFVWLSFDLIRFGWIEHLFWLGVVLSAIGLIRWGLLFAWICSAFCLTGSWFDQDLVWFGLPWLVLGSAWCELVRVAYRLSRFGLIGLVLSGLVWLELFWLGFRSVRLGFQIKGLDRLSFYL